MDNNVTSIEEKKTPVQPATVLVEPLLGTVVVNGNTLKGVGNNTRWVVDIDATSGQDVTITCVDFHGGREIKPDVMSFTIAPLTHPAWDAKPVGAQDGASLTIKSLVVALSPAGAPLRYRCRVSIDIIHRSR